MGRGAGSETKEMLTGRRRGILVNPVAPAISEEKERRLSRFRGVLVGSAVGDALGAPIEFASSAEILRRYPGGLSSYATAYGRRGAITDDTQMTMFTAESLILADFKRREQGELDSADTEYIRQAYLRWFETQTSAEQDYRENGWLLSIPALHSRRAPGNTCLSALSEGGFGTVQEPINDSKGCGGVMRVAPVALAYAAEREGTSEAERLEEAFAVASEAAALTHGHVSGYLSSGALAVILIKLLNNSDLESSVQAALVELAKHEGHEETSEWLESALEFAKGEVTPETIDQWCGGSGGWVGEEALAIGVACALKASGFPDGVKLAVNHSGDTDSTGQIAGAMLGAIYGADAIPERAVRDLELSGEIDQMARDLYNHFGGDYADSDEERGRYFASRPFERRSPSQH